MSKFDRLVPDSAPVARHKAAEAAVVARLDHFKSQAIAAFVTLKSGNAPTPELKEELRMWAAKEIGSLAKPDDIRFTDSLPKTRSGKIMRGLPSATPASRSYIISTSGGSHDHRLATAPRNRHPV